MGFLVFIYKNIHKQTGEMKKEALISVIVPAYNVEKYIRKCLDSVCGQTYRNLEIIVVDDGSADGTGAICDEFAARDGRVRVLHLENCGVGAARNRGFDCATGELIGFVDSDDWAEPDMFETLCNVLVDNDVDISICSYFRERKSGTKPQSDDGKVFSLTSKQALSELITDKTYKNYLWNKLFRRSLFDGIRFPENTHYEDVAVVYRLFAKAQAFKCVNRPLYHHVYRTGSIVRPCFYDAESFFQFFLVLAERSRFMRSYDRDVWKLTQDSIAHKGIQLIERSFLDAASSERNPYIVETCLKELSAVDTRYVRPHYRLQRWLVMRRLPLYRRLYLAFRSVFRSKLNFRQA